eukprot:gene10544-19273_t
MSLVDFQYITPKPLQNAFSTVETSSLLDEQQPLHIVPAIFSRIDVQGSYNYHPETFNRLGTKGNPAHRESLNPEEEIPHQQSDSRMRKRRPSEAMAAIFTSKEVPQEPGAKCREIVDSTKKKFSWVESSLEELRELFRERPMWSRTALVCHLSTEIKNERLKQLLPYVAFYWLNGPWRALWNRFGYDPRKLPEAKIYQICDFRVRDKKDSKGLPILPLRSSRICTLPVQLQRYKVNAAVSVDNQQKPEAKRSAIPPEDLLYTFHPDKLPRARQIMYQLCDLYDDEVQQIISENNGKLRFETLPGKIRSALRGDKGVEPPCANQLSSFDLRPCRGKSALPFGEIKGLNRRAERKCTERNGWFNPGVIDRIRATMVRKVEARIEKEIAEKEKKHGDINEEINTSDVDKETVSDGIDDDDDM